MNQYASASLSLALLWVVLAASLGESQDSALEQWRTYERDLKSWCATTAPSAPERCVREELQRKGVSPTLFDTAHPPQMPEASAMPLSSNDLGELSNKLHRKEAQQKNEVKRKEEDSPSTIVVIPGKLVGKFSLGMRKEDGLKIAPKPQENTPNRLVYKNKKTGNILIAHFEKDKIVQIDFTSKNFYTAEGIHVGNFQDAKYAGLFVVWRLPGTSEALKLTLKAGGLTFYSPGVGLLGPDASSLAIGVVHEGQNLIYELRSIEGKENGGWIKESVVESSRYVPDFSSQPALSTPPRPYEPKVDYSPSSRDMETTGLLLQGLLLLLFGLAIYFLPTIIASWSPRHHNAVAIFVLNLFLGWTFIGWVVALVWSCTQSRPQSTTTTSLFLSLFLSTIVVLVISTQFTIFVVQPIGAVPDGRTLLLWRGKKMQFIDSADALCAREMGGVSLLCRGIVLGKVVDVNTILLRMPYSDIAYRWSTGGARYEKRDQAREERLSPQAASPSPSVSAHEVKCREIARREYPNDLQMQNYIYEQQINAARHMAIVSDQDVKQIALREYPEDFSMQKYVYDQQSSAKRYMAAMPNDSAKYQAISEYPYDYSTQKYTYDNLRRER